MSWQLSWSQATEEWRAVWPKPGRTLDTLEGHDTHRHEERKKWCRVRAGNEPRIYRSPSGGCGCCCWSRIFLRRASTTGFSYWVFLFIWLWQTDGERKQDNTGDTWSEERRLQHTERKDWIRRSPVFLCEVMCAINLLYIVHPVHWVFYPFPPWRQLWNTEDIQH